MPKRAYKRINANKGINLKMSRQKNQCQHSKIKGNTKACPTRQNYMSKP